MGSDRWLEERELDHVRTAQLRSGIRSLLTEDDSQRQHMLAGNHLPGWARRWLENLLDQTETKR